MSRHQTERERSIKWGSYSHQCRHL